MNREISWAIAGEPDNPKGEFFDFVPKMTWQLEAKEALISFQLAAVSSAWGGKNTEKDFRKNFIIILNCERRHGFLSLF